MAVVVRGLSRSNNPSGELKFFNSTVLLLLTVFYVI
jgi:hypothetical protein